MSESLQLFRPKYEVDACMKEIRSVLESGWTGQGPKCSAFEKAWCEYTGCRNAHFVSSATAALHIALRLTGKPEGTKVATTPMTFLSTNAVILYERMVPVFCECEIDMSLQFGSVRDAILKKGAKVVMWVHYGGNVSNEFYWLMDEIKNDKRFAEVRVIEDCAHAAGASYRDGTMVGSRTDTISCFSFHSVKNLPIMDGGMLCVPDVELDQRARKLSWMGIDKSTYARTEGSGSELYKWSYNVPELGWKYNGNDIAASIGLVQLKYLDRDNAYRRWIAEQYEHQLGAKKMLTHNRGSSHHLVVTFVSDRDKVIAALKAAGIAPGVHYLPNYKFPVFAGFDHKQCDRVEEMSKHIISLPNHLELNRSLLNKVCETLSDCGAFTE